MMVSVLMSVFKEKLDWVQQSCESILNQTYKDIELIIVIDNPDLAPDVTEYMVSLASRDTRVILVKNENNLGVPGCMNKALKIARGEYFAKMDADDVSLPNRIERELEYLQEKNADLVTTNAFYIDEENQNIGKSNRIPEEQNLYLPYENGVIHPSVLGKMEALKEVGGYRAFRRAQDYDLWLRMVANHKKIVALNEYLIKYRRNRSQASTTHRLEQYYNVKYQRKLFKERLRTGNDSFSPENLQKYLESKKITDEKNIRCIQVFTLLSSVKKANGFFSKAKIMVQALRLYPSITCSSVVSSVQKRVAMRASQTQR